MSYQSDPPARPPDPKDDCPLPVGVQRRNIYCFAAFWGIYYLAAPISYIGLTHANLLKALGNNDTICNLPSAVYLWLTVVPVLAAWFFPNPKYLKPLGLLSVGLMAAMTAAVAVTLGMGATPAVSTVVVIAHGAVFGAANGVLFTALWDSVKRGVSTSRRGAALGLAFGAGPLLACVGALLQDALFDGKFFGGHSFGLKYPHNYLALFAVVSPLLLGAGVVLSLFTLPRPGELVLEVQSPWREITAGLKQFFEKRTVWYAVVLYVVVYSGGNAIFSNVSLHAKAVLGREGTTSLISSALGQAGGLPTPWQIGWAGEALIKTETDTLGVQSFLRFGCKAVAGVLLGWLLAASSPRAAMLATTATLLVGMGWALNSTGWWFMATFGLLGAGELFGVYFPNYVATASEKKFVRVNIAYLSVLSGLVGFSSLAFGAIAEAYGRIASFYVAAGVLAFALLLICVLLPPDPTPREKAPELDQPFDRPVSLPKSRDITESR